MGHVVGPSLGCQQLVEAAVVRKAAGDASSLHRLHHSEEGLQGAIPFGRHLAMGQKPG